MELGIIPDILLCRSGQALTQDLKSKIALFCNVSERNVISAMDVTGSIYEIPYMFHENEYDSIVLEHFKMDKKPFKVPAWDKFLKSLQNPETDVQDRRGGQVHLPPGLVQVDIRGDPPRRGGQPGAP